MYIAIITDCDKKLKVAALSHEALEKKIVTACQQELDMDVYNIEDIYSAELTRPMYSLEMYYVSSDMRVMEVR